MTMTGEPTAETSARRQGIDTLSWLVIVLFGLLFAYDLWEALANLFGLAGVLGWELLSVNLWLLLSLLILAPVVVYVVALRVGRRMNFWQRGLVLLAGWGLVAIITLDVYALLRASTAS